MSSFPFQPDLRNLQAVFFDFDGVLVDSVQIKLDAYREIFRPFGREAEEEITAYHLANGGVDRFRKISYVLQKFSLSLDNLERLAHQFSQLVKEKVISAKPIPGLLDLALLLKENNINNFVVSGTPEDELKEIVQKRGWSDIFTSIHGSPETKIEICNTLLQSYNLEPSQTIFIGDATTDFHTARTCKLWFLGVPF